MLRIFMFLLATGFAVAAEAQSSRGPAQSQRLVLYVDADSPEVKGSIARFEAALERRGIGQRYHVKVRHVGIDVFDRKEAARRIGSALRDRPAVIIATSSESAGIAREVAGDVPVVFGSHQDPVRLGLVRSLADPGGNITGFTLFAPIDMKRLELLRELAPRARRLGIIVDRWWMDETDGRAILRDAKTRLGFEGEIFLMEKVDDLRQLDSAAARAMEAWYVPPTTLPGEHLSAVVRALNSVRKPAVFPTTRFALAGGLAAYQPRQSLDEAFDVFAKLTGLVLDGVPPGQIPVERPKSFELALNAQEARRLGIPLSDALLKRADRVIDGPSRTETRCSAASSGSMRRC
jgi:putative tryptophan/tyrosine transport system substrate-binding protein